MPPPTAAASAGFLTERLEALLYMEAVTQQFFPLLLLECFNGSEILFCILQLQQQQLWYCESLRGFCFAAFAFAAAISSESVIFLRHLFRFLSLPSEGLFSVDCV